MKQKVFIYDPHVLQLCTIIWSLQSALDIVLQSKMLYDPLAE